MKKWNTGPFDNEEAQGLLEDIREHAVPLDQILPTSGHRYLEADHGALVVAMAHLAAGELPEGISDEDVAVLREPRNREVLRQSLEAVLVDATVSGLYSEWEAEGVDKLHEWKARSHVALA